MKPQWIPKLLITKAVLLALLWGGYNALATTPGEEGASASNGTVYYVAPTGSDSNPGTEDQPWQTIQKAANTLVAGDTVYIRAGTYQERIEPQNSGSADNYIVYAAYPGDTVTIDGASITVPEWCGLFEIDYKAYIRVSGLRIINARSNPHNPGILVDTSSHIIIENNYVYNTNDSGIGVWSSDNVILDHNEVEGACQSGWNEGISVGSTNIFEVRYNHVHHSYPKEGICVKDDASNGQVYRNRVDHTGAVGIYVDAQDKHTFNIDVFQNVVHDVSSNGIALASEAGGLLEHIRVYNNVVYHNEFVGIWLSGCCPGVASHPLSDLKIINNTLYNNGWEWGGGIGVDRNPDIQKVTLQNNLCSQNLSFQIAIDSVVSTQTLTVTHNLIDGYRGGEGEVYGVAPVIGDPLLRQPSEADFHLQPHSPAIDHGSAVDAPADDFDGNPRPQDGDQDHIALFDIGAYEFGGWRIYLPIVVTLLSANLGFEAVLDKMTYYRLNS